MTLFLWGIFWLFFLLFEIFFPRKKNIFWKRGLFLDIIFVAINGFFFWMFWPDLRAILAPILPFSPISLFPFTFPVQFLLVFLSLDFTKWMTHRALHTFPALWHFHRLHHTITDLHFARVLFYNPVENIFYAITTLPIVLFLSFDPAIWLILIPTEAFIGYMNHTNTRLRVPYWLACIVNTPQAHIWHHDKHPVPSTGVNFGISLSLWDFLWGTLFLSDKNPIELGVKK